MRLVGIIVLFPVILVLGSGLVCAADQGEGSRENGGGSSQQALSASDLAVIVNDADPTSVRIGQYYKTQRHVPDDNIIHVRFKSGNPTMSRTDFQRVKAEADSTTPSHVQAYALAWTQPYRVECMSITTAFAAGFDRRFCSNACGPTRPSPYFNSNSRRPHNDYGWRPAMMLAGKTYQDVKKLIDRGVSADATFPSGTGYLVSTSDAARNVRAAMYPELIAEFFSSAFDLRIVKADFIENRKNVLFYFTGVKQVKGLETIHFAPGAIADHLTSAGGDLLSRGDQMSSLRWLEAGATGSYGAVVEPCNYLTKFPNPGIIINHYLAGETLLESYWKSVAWPGQGIFIGEPLAVPFRKRVEIAHAR